MRQLTVSQSYKDTGLELDAWLQLLASIALDVPVAVETYGQRKRIQWTIYLLQRTGHNLAYHFRGSMADVPYCKELLADVENIILNNHIDPGWTSKWEMNDGMKVSIQQAKLRWEKPKSLNIDEMQWLDLPVRWDWGLNKQGLNEILVANDIINRVRVPWNAVLAVRAGWLRAPRDDGCSTTGRIRYRPY